MDKRARARRLVAHLAPIGAGGHSFEARPLGDPGRPLPGVSDEEWAARCQLAAGYRISHSLGWDLVVYNHITLKVPGSDAEPGGPHFLINPFGLGFDEVTASSLLKVDLDGNMIHPGDGSGQLFQNGFVVHSAVHAARPELHAAVHSHHEDTTAVSMTRHGLLPLSQEALRLWGRIAYHKFEGAASDEAERPRMAASMQRYDHAILENHGPLCCGRSLPEAFEAMLNLTRACTYQVKALAMVGGDLSKLHMPSREEAERMQGRDPRVDPTSASTVDPNSASTADGVQLMWDRWVRSVEAKYGAHSIYI